jgi:hypothetical protein
MHIPYFHLAYFTLVFYSLSCVHIQGEGFLFGPENAHPSFSLSFKSSSFCFGSSCWRTQSDGLLSVPGHFCPSFSLSKVIPLSSRQLSVQVRAAAAHKVKDFCLALDKSIQEQVIMNHLLPCVKVISFFVGLVEFFFSP